MHAIFPRDVDRDAQEALYERLGFSMPSDLERFDRLRASPITLGENELADYLSSVLSGIDVAKTGKLVPSSGVFWALTRVFGCYDRVAELCEQYRPHDDSPFSAELEIEHFLMRLRVLLDEAAYAIRIRMPNTVRGLSEPGGPTPYKQFSINAFLKFVKKNPNCCPHLKRLIENNRANIDRYITIRDDIAHFRAKALIFLGETMSVGFAGARESEGHGILPYTDLRTYIDSASTWMWNFLERDVIEYFRGRIADGEIDFKPLGLGPYRISMLGITRFKRASGSGLEE